MNLKSSEADILMSEQEQLNKLLLEVSQSPTIDYGDYASAMKYVTQICRAGLDVARCSVWQLDKTFTQIRCLILNHSKGIEESNNTCTETDYPAYFKALREKRFIVADNAQVDPDTFEFKDYLQEEHIASILDAPIRQGGHIVGTLCCEHTGQIRAWSPDEQSFVGSLADILGRALTAQDRRQVQQSLEESNQYLSKLIDERTHHLSLAFEQISEQEKMASLGKLVAGVAHEINNPIGLGITTATHIEDMTLQISKAFQEGTITQSQFKEYIEVVEEGSLLLIENLHRAADLVKSFKQIAVDQSDNSFLEINLVETLNNIVNSLKAELKKKHQTTIQLNCPKNILLNTCPGSIAQIMTNLLMNAGIHAFPEEQTDRHVSITVEDQQTQIKLCVKDNGQGIRPEIINKIYEPFVTTRRSQGGSGLGLNIVHNLVTQKLQGTIEVESQPNQFTRFIVFIPKTLETTN